MQKVSWFFRISAIGLLALIVAVAAFGGSYQVSASDVALQATQGAAASFPLCYAAANIAQVRIVHASPNTGAADVYMDNATTPSVTGLAYDKATAYVEVTAGSHHLKVTKAGDAKTVWAEADVTVAGLTAYTVVAEGTTADKTFALKSYTDDASDTAGGVRFEIIHAVPDGGAADLVNTGDSNTVLASNIAFGGSVELNVALPSLKATVTQLGSKNGVTTAVTVGSGNATIDLALTASGDATKVLIPLKGTALTPDTIYTIVATGLVGSKTVKAVALAPVILTSKSIAGFQAPPVATPEATAAATKSAAVIEAKPLPQATKAATAAPTKAATAASASAGPTNVPVGVKPASAGWVLNTSKLKHLNDGACVQVAAISPAGGPADSAGFKVGDLILAINGKALAKASDFETIIAAHASGDKLTVTDQRKGTTTVDTVTLTLGANPFLGG